LNAPVAVAARAEVRAGLADAPYHVGWQIPAH